MHNEHVMTRGMHLLSHTLRAHISSFDTKRSSFFGACDRLPHQKKALFVKKPLCEPEGREHTTKGREGARGNEQRLELGGSSPSSSSISDETREIETGCEVACDNEDLLLFSPEDVYAIYGGLRKREEWVRFRCLLSGRGAGVAPWYRNS